MSFCAYDNYSTYNYAYYKVSLIKVIDISKVNTIFSNYILYKLKPLANKSQIFIFSSLILISIKKIDLKL